MRFCRGSNAVRGFRARSDSAVTNSRIQVQHPGHVFSILNAELEVVIQPMLAEAVPVLRGYRDGVLLPAEQTIQLEFQFAGFAVFETPQLDLLLPSVRAEDVHSDPVADQNAH